MGLLDNVAKFNNWQVGAGTKLTIEVNLIGYIKSKNYTKNLKKELPHSLKELIVKDINSMPRVKRTGIITTSNVDEMIDILNKVKDKKTEIFEELKKEDFFQAFRYLHKLTYE